MARVRSLPSLMRFAENLAKRSHRRWPLNTSILEGTNNKIKVLKWIGYGYRDEASFSLKIGAAFPGSP